jgi:hypothetical protein
MALAEGTGNRTHYATAHRALGERTDQRDDGEDLRNAGQGIDAQFCHEVQFDQTDAGRGHRDESVRRRQPQHQANEGRFQ